MPRNGEIAGNAVYVYVSIDTAERSDTGQGAEV